VTPYILEEERELECCESYELMPPETGAQLNYVLCRLITRFQEYHGLNYDTITEIRGAMYGAIEEYENVVAGPYEKIKRTINKPDIWGDLPEQLMSLARSPLQDIAV